MSDHSGIEWTNATWNPVRGCTKVSPGCKHCYAETFAERFRGVPGHPFEQGFDLRLVPSALTLPLQLAAGPVRFRQQHVGPLPRRCPRRLHRRVFAVMREASQHQFQVLTKRAERMAVLASRIGVPRNVWMGVSVETDEYQDRIAQLRSVPAEVRFLSLEPLLGPLPRLTPERHPLGHCRRRERTRCTSHGAGMGSPDPQPVQA